MAADLAAILGRVKVINQYPSAGRGLKPVQKTHKGAFARSVGPDDPDPLFTKREVDIFQHPALIELHGNIFKTDHGVVGPACCGK